jgi:arylsulfatase A-like enzyme
MKAILLMFDSLNRHMLPPYGCDWVYAPNFKRLAERSVVFDNCYVGSMPCMPARRELHTGRYNFLHASWGPIEPFDDSMPELLKDHGIYTHLISDHYHYWEDGGATYHTRYRSWENVRGQEGDPWKGMVCDPPIPENLNGRGGIWGRQDWVNRQVMQEEDQFSQAVTFRLGLEFLRKNAQADHWFLHIETFDPHEPYFSPKKYKNLYPHEYHGPVYDWPPYRRVNETPEAAQHLVYEYAALLSMCDAQLGLILDMMDELDLWQDTLLIVNTDHGFLLGEHGWWAKCVQPFYNEVAHIPLFVWDPRLGLKGRRRSALVQTIDVAPTLLEFFGVEVPADMQGRPLREVVATDQPVREAGLFGLFGAQVNCTDGRYVYMRGPAKPGNQPLYEYTLMPTGHGSGRAFTSHEELLTMELSEPFSFTKGLKTLKIQSRGFHGNDFYPFGTLLFDLEADPRQEHPMQDPVVEARMIEHLVRLMKENDAPTEQFTRFGLDEYR